MLRSNTLQARANIQNYIMEGACFEDYDIPEPTTFQETAKAIMNVFNSEMPAVGGYRLTSEYERFTNWAQGLPLVLDTCYYYNRSAVDDLGEILETTRAERKRFTESQAEERLTSLIYRELKRGCR